ncbi:ribonuclease P protein component [Thioalkalivibrio sp. XN279]|nr:ribonuclease P protein component [Thioalkalivibrio sp. XN279]NHA15810.1 ribonuclease P protein component [Thioalkalivibrio sp. XN279]
MRADGPSAGGEHAAGQHPHRFARSQRLLSPPEFGRVFRTGRRHGDRYFSLVFAPGPGPAARLGLAISRKVSRRAVQRNRIKRVVRECFRRRPDLPVVDIVVMARPGAAACDNRELTASIEALLERTARTCAASRSS